MHITSRTAGPRALRAGSIALGVATGVFLIGLGGAVASGEGSTERDAPAAVEAAHVAPLLTVPGERVELAYDVYCLPSSESDPETRCDAEGAAFVRSNDRGEFQRVPLRREPGRAEGRYVAEVPDTLARSPQGFAYYAVIEDRATGATTTVPSGGAESPHRSLPLTNVVDVDLGSHRFGRTRGETARVAAAAWGDGLAEAGLEPGRSATPIGGSSFDVGSDGTVVVLDQAKRRALRWSPGSTAPMAIPLAIDGTIADLAASDHDRLFVLETAAHEGRSPALRSFTASGRPIDTAGVTGRPYRVRLSSAGAPYLLQQESGLWTRAGTADGRLTGAGVSPAPGRAGQPSANDTEVVLLRTGDEVRVAVLGAGASRRAWRIRSATPLAEVQLAEVYGSRLVLVVRTFTDREAEFLVLVLGARGLVERFAVPAADWAETAPLSRFRLVGPTLFQLGSTPAGLFVDRFDLEVT